MKWTPLKAVIMMHKHFPLYHYCEFCEQFPVHCAENSPQLAQFLKFTYHKNVKTAMRGNCLLCICLDPKCEDAIAEAHTQI